MSVGFLYIDAAHPRGARDPPLVKHLDSFWNPAQGTLVAYVKRWSPRSSGRPKAGRKPR
jgi:hypothetical protein